MSRQMIEAYQALIKDELVWLYIFGEKKPKLDNMDSILRAINNTINLTFVYILSCIRMMHNTVEDIEEKKKTFNPNAKRAIKNIDRLFNELDVSFELVNYILLDVQFDLALGRNSCLRKYLPGVTEDFIPLDYSPMLLHWMSSSNSESGVSLDEMIILFQKLIDALPFLGGISLREKDGDTCFILQKWLASQTEHKKEDIYTDYKIYIQDCGRGFFQLYFLERVEITQHLCTLHYITPDYTDKYAVVYYDESFKLEKQDDEWHKYNQVEPDELEPIWCCVTGRGVDTIEVRKKMGDGIHNIFAVNYKYLKNLSLAISDELGITNNTVLRETFLNKYGIVLEENGDLDSVIFMCLIEHTPTTVLYDLFFINDQAVHAIIINLYHRFNGHISFDRVNFDQDPIDFSDLDRHFLNNLHSGHRFVRYGELADLQANYIISMILSNHKNENQRVLPIIDDIEHIRLKKKLADAQVTLAHILMRTCIFYQGIMT